jgi:hypothetical protein
VKKSGAAPRSSAAAPGETSEMSLIRAVLELARRGWRGITMAPMAVAVIESVRRGREHVQPSSRPSR